MALESAPGSALGRIDPSSLVGLATPVVEPRATAALAEAFRSGMINANDIHDRVSERAKSKEKMEITLANRATAEAEDPALQEARRQQMLGAGAQGQLASAQAAAAQGLLPAETMAKQFELERAQGEARYPASKHFDALAALGGVKALPLTETGAVDYAKKAEIGAELQLWKTRQDIAKAKLENIVGKEAENPAGTGMYSFTKQGDPSLPAERDALRKTAEAPFVPSGTAPGTVAAPVVAAPAPAPAPAPSPAAVTVEPAAAPPAMAVVEPKAPSAVQAAVDATFAPVTGTPLPGGGYQLGTRPPKSSEAGDAVKMTGEQAMLLGRSTFTRDLTGLLKREYDTLLKAAPWYAGGSIRGRVGKLTLAEERHPALSNFKSKASGILAPLVKGIYGETGVLSQADIDRYAPNIPSPNDSYEVGLSKIQGLNEVIHTSIINNINAMDLQKQNLDPRIGALKQVSQEALAKIEADRAAAEGRTPAAGGTPVTPSAVIATPTGRSFQQDATGNWVLAK